MVLVGKQRQGVDRRDGDARQGPLGLRRIEDVGCRRGVMNAQVAPRIAHQETPARVFCLDVGDRCLVAGEVTDMGQVMLVPGIAHREVLANLPIGGPGDDRHRAIEQHHLRHMAAVGDLHRSTVLGAAQVADVVVVDIAGIVGDVEVAEAVVDQDLTSMAIEAGKLGRGLLHGHRAGHDVLPAVEGSHHQGAVVEFGCRVDTPVAELERQHLNGTPCFVQGQGGIAKGKSQLRLDMAQVFRVGNRVLHLPEADVAVVVSVGKGPGGGKTGCEGRSRRAIGSWHIERRAQVASLKVEEGNAPRVGEGRPQGVVAVDGEVLEPLAACHPGNGVGLLGGDLGRLEERHDLGEQVDEDHSQRDHDPDAGSTDAVA
ncbi:hypothetical protein [Halomonas sp. BC04]|uniref:hypothetical protein n=1 Tax=Halomonas sp. BC04 TaxID=1403540 RepID=UPI0003ED7F0E|nr:hypothetical protein [Halomonas sp. BC04]EWH02567.1 hypothetical protein Q427_08145 [Halomonas sp. BC04]